MTDYELDQYFDNQEDLQAYQAFIAEQEFGNPRFDLDQPVLVCRWRMAHRRVPLLARHIRALAARRINGQAVQKNLVAWAKQHIEWSLADAELTDPSGVLMLVIDVHGNAAMSVGPYQPLPEENLNQPLRPHAEFLPIASPELLLERARLARSEFHATGIAPEVLCAQQDMQLLIYDECGTNPHQTCASAAKHAHAKVSRVSAGVLSLVKQLAQTKGLSCVYVSDLPSRDELLQDSFLVSDEHGIVHSALPEAATPSAAQPFIQLAQQGYEKLLAKQ
ncbi:hypothetical protein KPC83_02280 [Collinsella sp. zg1085]|uniref:hypothetical protein n=1 Tax=Collinsella sp. zg1085 TaxID=2844380 RepID=UPI001C0B6D2C|nr:hypothetical protein [Collinsella sp. zg1085]QWT17986.1 hypothetical protein KPC83_02280 [Collinsella sp. zg1085]